MLRGEQLVGNLMNTVYIQVYCKVYLRFQVHSKRIPPLPGIQKYPKYPCVSRATAELNHGMVVLSRIF